MMTLLLVVLAVVAIMGLVGGVSMVLGGDGFFGFWLGMEAIKGGGYLLGIVLTALAESMNQG